MFFKGESNSRITSVVLPPNSHNIHRVLRKPFRATRTKIRCRFWSGQKAVFRPWLAGDHRSQLQSNHRNAKSESGKFRNNDLRVPIPAAPIQGSPKFPGSLYFTSH